jgi:uncharacterized RDD family membrane protein YckC
MRRLAAWLVDALPGVAAAWGVAVWSGQGGRWLTTLPGLGWAESVAVRLSGDPWSVVWSLVALSVPYIFVASMIEGITSQTPGRWMLRIEVVDSSGQPAARGIRAIRAAFQILTPLTLGLSALWSLVGREGRSWHDILSNTWVVNKIH